MHIRKNKRTHHSVRERLEFIEFRLYWETRINRSDIVSFFDVSTQQASTDLAQYLELAPANLEYDRSEKAYIASDGFTPIFGEPSARKYLSQLRLTDDKVIDIGDTWIGTPPPFAAVPLLRRPTPGGILRPICHAVRQGKAMEIEYQSFNHPVPAWRVIEPHALVFDGRRWHVRAWCRRNADFRDFVIGRIGRVGAQSKRQRDTQFDLAWHRTTELKIGPNPGLDSQRQRLVQIDYDMKEGFTTVQARIALIFYIKAYLLLGNDFAVLRPAVAPLALLNSDEVDFDENQAKSDSARLNT